MAWTVGTFWTMGNDALDARGRFVDCLDTGTDWPGGQDDVHSVHRNASVPPTGQHWQLAIHNTPMKHAAAKVAGNQRRMLGGGGRGFLHCPAKRRGVH